MSTTSSPSDYKIPIQIRWADIDANNHLLHSVYYDYGAMIRIRIMTDLGLSMKRLEELRCGPIIFREEAQFKREVLFHDNITIDIKMLRARQDFARWSLQHQIVKNQAELCTIITLDGAFIDLDKRKIIIPPAEVCNVFEKIPKSENFEWVAGK